MIVWTSFVFFTAVFAKHPSDSHSSATDFFPSFNGFQPFPVQSSSVLPSHDLTALQQTHVLGDFQHRFQQQRFNPPSFQNQPLLFSQQTSFGDPQIGFNDQPPQQVLPPPREQNIQQNQFSQTPPFRPFPPAQQSFQPHFQESRNPFTDHRKHRPEEARQQQPNFHDQSLRNRPPQFQDSRPPFTEQRNPPREESRPQQPTFQDQQLRNGQQQFNAPPPDKPFQDQRNRPPQFQDSRPPFTDQRNPPREESRPQHSTFQDQQLRNGQQQFNAPPPDKSFQSQQPFRPVQQRPTQEEIVRPFLNKHNSFEEQRHQQKQQFHDNRDPSIRSNPFQDHQSSNVISDAARFSDQRNPSFESQQNSISQFQPQRNTHTSAIFPQRDNNAVPPPPPAPPVPNQSSSQNKPPRVNTQFSIVPSDSQSFAELGKEQIPPTFNSISNSNNPFQQSFSQNVAIQPTIDSNRHFSQNQFPESNSNRPPFSPNQFSESNSIRPPFAPNQFSESHSNRPPFSPNQFSESNSNRQSFSQNQFPESNSIRPPFAPNEYSESNSNKPPIAQNQYLNNAGDGTAEYNLNIVHTRGPQQAQTNQISTISDRRPLLPLLPTEPPFQLGPSSTEGNSFTLQSSLYPSSFGSTINEISQTPSGIESSTPKPAKTKKPKPEVKEITINLGPTPLPPEPTKKDKSTRKEKSQEEIINEQIQKLLDSHKLELLTNPPKDGGGVPIPDLPDDLKGKVKIQLVNPDLLSEVQKGDVRTDFPTTTPEPILPPLPELPEHIKKQYDIKLVQKDELFKQFNIGTGGKIVANSDLVSPFPGKTNAANGSTVYLANGQQLQVVNFANNDQLRSATVIATTTTTSKPPKELFDELAKGVIPPGANFELIKHGPDGQIEKVKDVTSAKKVTFVLLEEQPDGSVKIQGVKGNGSPEKTDKESVDSLLEKLKDGSLKLPPSNNIISNEITQAENRYHEVSSTAFPFTSRDTDYATESYTSTTAQIYNTIGAEINSFPTSVPYEDKESTFVPTISTLTTASKRPKSKSRPNFLPTPTYNNVDSSQSTSATKRYKASKRPLRRKSTTTSTTTTTTTPQYEYDDEEYNHRSSNYNGEGPIPQDVVGQESNPQPSRSLTAILQDYNLNEMAKFLDQSGLDTILNETGPYTIFIPTDEAFANLQVQLGGTDKAEDKFRENPRLLSGLLLHHVVPGSFKVSDLQDEMTGVSLAGTQLRVNTYNSERKQTLVTINGAVVSEEKRDIAVPQGIAHAVDRVLFPLPVGDLYQTLKGDRERRFTKFIKAVESSGLTELLTGGKTYTVFAPTDRAFAALTDSELDKLLAKREAARTIVLRHVSPGSLYSAGMHYFQVKESMERGQKITILKDQGKVKANAAQVSAANVPATNGVIHIVDSLL